MHILVLDENAEAYAEHLRAAHSGISVTAATTAAAALAAAADANVIAALAHNIPQTLVDAAPKLAWIAALTTGVDAIHALANLPPHVAVTSARGIHGPQMAEMAFVYMMSLSRDFPKMLANQQARVWQRWPQRLLLGKTAVLVGVGSIGEELAHRCKAFGMRVVGVSSGRVSAPGFDLVLPRQSLCEAVATGDFVIALVPYAPGTHHIIDGPVFGAMKPSAFYINLARGNVTDEQALIAALLEGRIAGAGLDVFATEPLPPDSPLWTMPNVIATPHIGGMSDVYVQQILPLLDFNIAAFRSGNLAGMRNLVELNR